MVDLRLVLALFLLLASTAQARPGDLDRSFGDRGRVAFLRESGGFVAGMTLVDGRRPLLSVGTGLYGNPAPRLLTLTAAGTMAGMTPVAALAAPQFNDGYALTHVGDDPTRYSLARIGENASVALTVPFPSTPLGARSLDRDLRRRPRGPHPRDCHRSTWARSGASSRCATCRTGRLDTSYRSELGNRLIVGLAGPARWAAVRRSPGCAAAACACGRSTLPAARLRASAPGRCAPAASAGSRSRH